MSWKILDSIWICPLSTDNKGIVMKLCCVTVICPSQGSVRMYYLLTTAVFTKLMYWTSNQHMYRNMTILFPFAHINFHAMFSSWVLFLQPVDDFTLESFVIQIVFVFTSTWALNQCHSCYLFFMWIVAESNCWTVLFLRWGTLHLFRTKGNNSCSVYNKLILQILMLSILLQLEFLSSEVSKSGSYCIVFVRKTTLGWLTCITSFVLFWF